MKVDKYIKHYLSLGWNIIPVQGKKPLWKWQQYQKKKVPVEFWDMMGEVEGIAVICGSISGNLVVLDFDSKAYYAKFVEHFPEAKFFPTALSGSRNGYHVFIKIPEKPPAKKNLKPKGGGKGIDILAEGSYVVLPPSLHPSGKKYVWIKEPKTEDDIPIIEMNKFHNMIEVIKEILGIKDNEGEDDEHPKDTESITVLPKKGDHTILKYDLIVVADEIVNVISEIYKEGQRQNVALALCGWLRKEGVPENTTENIIRLLAKATGDTELQQRLTAVRTTYQKPDPENLLGIDGLLTLAEQTMGGRRKATRWIKKLTATIQKSPKKKTPDYEIITYDEYREIYIDYKDCKVDIIRYDKELNPIYLSTPLWAAPVDIKENYDFTCDKQTFKITFKRYGREDLLVEGDIDSIISILSSMAIAEETTIAKRVLTKIIQDRIRKNDVEYTEMPDRPGWFYYKGKVIFVPPPGWRDDWTKEEIKEHLKRLDKIITEAYAHMPEVAMMVIKWFVFAPFSYIYKTKGHVIERFKYLYLYGISNAGKSTLAHIGLSLWGIQGNPTFEMGKGLIESKAKVGDALASGTFPVVVNEVDNLWMNREKKQDIIDIIKDSIDSKIARKNMTRDGRKILIPATAPFCMTGNAHIPNDKALINRFLSIEFSKTVEIDKFSAQEFNKTRYYCPAAGWAIAQEIVAMLESGEWEGKIWDEIAMIAIERAYSKYTDIKPVWNMPLMYETVIDADSNIETELTEWMLRVINNEFIKHRVVLGYKDTEGVITLQEKINALSDGYIIRWLRTTNRGNVYILPDELFSVLPNNMKHSFIGSTKILREYIEMMFPNAKFDAVKIKFNGKYNSKKVIIVPIEDFITTLVGEERIEEDSTTEDMMIAGTSMKDFINE